MVRFCNRDITHCRYVLEIIFLCFLNLLLLVCYFIPTYLLFAYLGCPGQMAVKWLLLLLVCYFIYLRIAFS